MIDQEKLKASFKVLGEKRISYYVRLFLKKNKSFAAKLRNLYRKNDLHKIEELLHKLRGAVSVFHADSFVEILLQYEQKLQKEPQNFTESDVKFLCERFEAIKDELKNYLKDNLLT